VLDLLARTGQQLSEITAQIPKVHMAHETVVTPWEQKGLVMRSLVELAGRAVHHVDGVKSFHGDGWVLALPDPEEPITHVWSESSSDAEARRLAEEYGRRIRQLLR
jgi:mannose-1-phosphate guanylyltransferase/phosphomannomutase